jgi:hypothetical protein
MLAARIFKSLVALTIIAALGYAAYEAGRRGLADLASMRARHDVTAWVEKGTVPGEEAFNRTLDSLRAAARLTPEDQTLQESIGVAYDLAQTSVDPSLRWNAYAEYALLHFRLAANRQPTSPYASANLARIKYRLGQIDRELFGALDRAMTLGPWEPGVQLIASELGLLLWQKLDAPQQARMKENWSRTAFRQADQLIRIAKTHNLVPLLCTQSLGALKGRLKCGS